MPAALRLLHLVGIFTLGLMLWSGLLIYWAHDPYEITLFGYQVFHFFPEGFYKALGAERRLATGMGWHFVTQWLFIGNGLLYCGWLAVSGHWRTVLPTRWRDLPDSVLVALNDFHLVKKAPPIRGRYNAAQRYSYTGVIVLGAAATLSGWAMYKPVQLGWLLHLFGTYEVARAVHFITALLFVLFIFVHIAQVVRVGWRNIAAMLIGTPDPGPEGGDVKADARYRMPDAGGNTPDGIRPEATPS